MSIDTVTPETHAPRGAMRVHRPAVVMMPPVKRAVCFFLMLWLVLQAGMVQAHVWAEGLAHHAHPSLQAPAGHDVAKAESGATAETSATSATYKSGDADRCGVSHCCHTSCLPMAHAVPRLGEPAASKAPAAFEPLALRAALSDIDRPKWAAATPAVASPHS